LGTVIGLERAVALSGLSENSGYRWTYIGPLLSGLGAVALIIGRPALMGPVLITLGSLSLVLVFVSILRLQTALYTVTMAAGSVLWLLGNSLWLLGWPIYTVVSWWSGFLILTIVGERLELNRILRLSRPVITTLLLAIGLFLTGLVVSLFTLDFGIRLVGSGMLAMALWLLRYDIARYTVRKSGLTRFIAVCLLSGYGWLAVGGLLAMRFGGLAAGLQYDAIQHAVLVGFVMSMIFGHAPIIFPAITGRPVPFQTAFYSHLALLHLSLILRVGSDLVVWLPGRQWGGLLNAATIILFLVNTALAIRAAAIHPRRAEPQGAG
jgi:hypothetical protein